MKLTIRYGLAAVSLNMLMAVLAIEWSLLVHGFLHLHYDVCDLDNQTLSFSQEQNISSSHQHDLGPDYLESITKDNLDNFPEKNISNCYPSWPWININLHRLKLILQLIIITMLMTLMASMI